MKFRWYEIFDPSLWLIVSVGGAALNKSVDPYGEERKLIVRVDSDGNKTDIFVISEQ